MVRVGEDAGLDLRRQLRMREDPMATGLGSQRSVDLQDVRQLQPPASSDTGVAEERIAFVDGVDCVLSAEPFDFLTLYIERSAQ
jgi:hypothetical protein